MYGVGDADSEGTHLAPGLKHHIASQWLAPTQSNFTEKNIKKGSIKSKLTSHKKNQSISGIMKSEDMFKHNMKANKQTMDHSSVNR